MNPTECVKIMWGLINRHGMGMKHSQSRRIRHRECRKDNRWHENPLFSSSSRRSYWWEACQNFPESQSLTKELLHFYDSESKYFQSVSIPRASPAAEDSPHLLHTVTLNQGEMYHPNLECHFSAPTAKTMKTLTTWCCHLSISYFTLVWDSASPSDGEIIRLQISYVMLTSCFPIPHPFQKFLIFNRFMNLCLSAAVWSHLVSLSVMVMIFKVFSNLAVSMILWQVQAPRTSQGKHKAL